MDDLERSFHDTLLLTSEECIDVDEFVDLILQAEPLVDDITCTSIKRIGGCIRPVRYFRNLPSFSRFSSRLNFEAILIQILDEQTALRL